MADEPQFQLTRLLRRLVDAKVDFVVVGGVAVVIQASPRFTKDLDISYALDEENLNRLGGMLTQIGARLRAIDEDLPFIPDARTLSQTEILTLTTPNGDIDLLTKPPGSPDYETLRDRASRVDIDGATVLIASMQDLISMKRSAGRPQDLIDIEALEIALRRDGGD